MSLPVDRTGLVKGLKNYTTSFAEEINFRDSFLSLLQDEDAYQRWHLPGHITCSAWIVNAELNKALLIHHKKLDRWLQPGGHADGDENILRVALKEVAEETGVSEVQLIIHDIFDLDIHPIPKRADMPAHDHYDIRLLLRADESIPLIDNEEVKGIRWVELEQISPLCGYKSSILRMLAKMPIK